MSRSRKRHRLMQEQQQQGQNQNRIQPKHSKEQKESKSLEDSPVIIRYIDYGNPQKQAVPSISLHPDLDSLLYPLEGNVFLKNHLRQKAVHITCHEEWNELHATTRVTELCQEMCHLNVESILRETSSDNIFIWLRRPPEQSHDQRSKNGKSGGSNKRNNLRNKQQEKDLIQSIEISDVDTAIALYNVGGHATYCRAPPKVEQSLVSSLLRATGLGCGQYDPSGESMISLGRGEVETFVSTPGHVTNWHYDFQENFTIQLSGIKRWTIQQGTISDPIRGCTPHYAAPEAVESQLKAAHLFDRKFQFGHPVTGITATGKEVSIDVKPGDVFYFPAGMWHKVETIEPGVSINVSLMANNYAQLVGQAIQHYLFQFPEWRQSVRHNSAHDAIQHLNQLLQHLPDRLLGLSNAESILPPVLQHAPTFCPIEDDDIDDEEEEEGDQDMDHGERKQKRATKHDDDDDDDKEEEEEEEEESMGSSDGKDDVSSSEEEGVLTEEVIDPREYKDKNPEHWNALNLEVDTCLVFRRNPLAVLHRMDEMTKFYHHQQDERTTRGGMATLWENVFILNVNYAGNEMHQSAVRVVFCDSEAGFVQRLYEQLECTTAGDKILDVVVPHREIRQRIASQDLPFVEFLIYHGYITVSK